MMKKIFFFFILIIVPFVVFAQNDSLPEKKHAQKQHFFSLQGQDIVKTGCFVAPLPLLSYDQDKGWQFGAMLNIYDFGNGSFYPSTRQQWVISASYYHKGSQQYSIIYDAKHLIPKVRLSVAANLDYDQATNFHGFNGYMTKYDYGQVNFWAKQKDKTNMPSEYNPIFYRVEKMTLSFKFDFSGNIVGNKLFWQAGYCFDWYKWKSVNREKINKGKKADKIFEGNTLYDYFNLWGIISPQEQKGGFSSAIRLGLKYDSRDVEVFPNKGLLAEGHVRLAPRFLGTTHAYYTYYLSLRHYVPLVNNVLIFAYRWCYRGTFGKNIPYYMMSVWSVMGQESDKEGVGGYMTVRGLLKNRVQGLDVTFFNTELRYKVFKFQLLKQNWCLAFNAFFEGGMVTRQYDMTYKGPNDDVLRKKYDEYIDTQREQFHLTAGIGVRFIVNQNLVLSVDYACPLKKQDGNGALYLYTGLTF